MRREEKLKYEQRKKNTRQKERRVKRDEDKR